ncbi:phosphopentomutase [Pelobacter seleniigenes]|uniref:phosphopentomutase n=1 Tax=Pelobacter seleniigenes TaxID=407188 RepID=UPI0004A7747A|nr:phosphopentomutase [Pelobacter seleniigenes]
MFKRILLIVLDGVGVGALPDAATYGDQGAATLQHVAEASGGVCLPNLERLGLANIVPVKGLQPVDAPAGCWGKMAQKSAGKDSVTGHWELGGVVLEQPFSVFPEGFPPEIISAFSRIAGRPPLGNVAASGTEILRDLGEEHLATGRPIVYTSSDSVFQIAAHEDIISPATLYDLCRQMTSVLKPYNVCRVIARPFTGSCSDNFQRTCGRHDFPRKPDRPTLLQLLQSHGVYTCGIGKIRDLFAGEGLTEALTTRHNADGMEQTIAALAKINQGLVMTNLVDFDMLYGHRLDADGFADALEEFDGWLPKLYRSMQEDDLVIITADHGCDPTFPGTDHTREYVPLLAWSPSQVRPGPLGVRTTFADVGATIAQNFTIEFEQGTSFCSELLR